MFTPFNVHLYGHNSKKQNSRTRGITVHITPNEEDHTKCFVQVARCNPKDNYCKKKGVIQAQSRPKESFYIREVPRLLTDMQEKVEFYRWAPQNFDYILRNFFR